MKTPDECVDCQYLKCGPVEDRCTRDTCIHDPDGKREGDRQAARDLMYGSYPEMFREMRSDGGA